MKSKRIISLVVLISIITLGIFIYSCSKGNKDKKERFQIPEEVIDDICPTCESYEIWLPKGSSIENIEGKTENKIVITAPDGYIYYGLTMDGSIIIWEEKEQGGGSVTVTCNCTEGNAENCYPVGFDGKINCVMSAGCTKCERKETTSSPISKTEYEILSGGFVNPNLGVSFAQTNDSLPYAFEAMLQYPEIQAQIESFLLQFYSDLNDIPETQSDNGVMFAPDGYRFTVLNVYGRALLTLLPETKGLTSAGGTTYTCSCSGTSGECNTKSTWSPRGTFYSCEKNASNPCDQACNTMTVSDPDKKTNYTYLYYYY